MDNVYIYTDYVRIERIRNANGFVGGGIIVNPTTPPVQLSDYKIVNNAFVLLTAQEKTDRTTNERQSRRAEMRSDINRLLMRTSWVLDVNNVALAARKTGIAQYRADLRTFVIQVRDNNVDPFTLSFPVEPNNLDEV